MCMKTSLFAKSLLLFSMAVQGVMFRRLCCNFYQSLYDDAPTTTANLQMDIMVPVFERDDRLRVFATNLGTAVKNYRENTSEDIAISTFRLLVTRFSPEEQAQSAAFRQELADLSHLPLHDIVMVQSNNETTFSRARALTLLHHAACHTDTCLISRLDVDMEVRPEFFTHSIETVYRKQVPPLDEFNGEWQTSSLPPDTPTAYFPVVWSAYNPETIALVERQYKHELLKEKPTAEQLVQQLQDKMPEFSEHRGHWRPYGKGMYVLLGSDALKLTYNTSFEGWGGEDIDFYQRTVALPRRILRRKESGLIHTWHYKECVDTFTEDQVRNCKASVRREEGSELGRTLRWERNQALARAKALKEEKERKEAQKARVTTQPPPKTVVSKKEPTLEDALNVPLPVATYKRTLIKGSDNRASTKKAEDFDYPHLPVATYKRQHIAKKKHKLQPTATMEEFVQKKDEMAKALTKITIIDPQDEDEDDLLPPEKQ